MLDLQRQECEIVFEVSTVGRWDSAKCRMRNMSEVPYLTTWEMWDSGTESGMRIYLVGKVGNAGTNHKIDVNSVNVDV